MLRRTSYTRPHVLVLGNHKGGSGKSTLAMHVAMGLLAEGRRVACLDLDFQQRTLTTYIENRLSWARRRKISLDVPTYLCIDGFRSDRSYLADSARISLISSAVAAYEADHDFIVVDTPGGVNAATLFAHGLADTLITPVNDSFLDLDVIFSPRELQSEETNTPEYSETVRRALEAREVVTKKKTDWLVVRNRLLARSSRNAREVFSALHAAARTAGFRVVDGLSERVVFREFFSHGLTAFDFMETSLLGVKPTPSHVLARLEVRQLLTALQPPPSNGERPTSDLSAQGPHAGAQRFDKVS
jgi:chromosome partitioning protein